MEKRLTRTDYLFVLIFIFMLVLALGTFFLGVKLGQERSAAKYEGQISRQQDAAKAYSAYHQQYLVSFYHTIYQPYREFQTSWFDKLDVLEVNRSADASLLLKDLSKLAKDKYDEIIDKSMPESSPLLQEGQQNYAKSLKLFSEALSSLQSRANSMPAAELLKDMDSNAYLIEAKNFALAAQKNYYDSIVKWQQSASASIQTADAGKPLTIQEWNSLPLNVKNVYISGVLVNTKLYKPFTPQDLCIRIDEMIATGQASKYNLTQIQPVIEVLLATDAVRSGDFIRNKSRWYPNETLPQIPFFTGQN
ncbi:hypothetical protein [Paenibacillus sp. OAS669]|uniref:hypothetical protein n=1 Tax=Paenibacillus sp. OAS669 TaxID=2663821 RepID=UPI00178B2607|nr:hypothetical protein [Paenibacillus sp. OAS669]MBE1446001.1 hypothetical protein [Paenibacillus sp. OAS669]